MLVVIGSVIPEVNLLSFPPNWFADPPNLQTYDYIFTGEDPAELRAARRAAQHDLERGARRAARDPQQLLVVATAVMFINLVFGSLAAYAYARLRFPGRAAPSTSC